MNTECDFANIVTAHRSTLNTWTANSAHAILREETRPTETAISSPYMIDDFEVFFVHTGVQIPWLGVDGLTFELPSTATDQSGW